MPRVLRSLPVLCLIIGCLSALLVLVLRQVGLLEALELRLYDWHLRAHLSPASSDSRLTLVTVTEQDILRLGRWPLTDATLAQALDLVLAHQPRAIGLDIYRDIPVPPGRAELNARFAAAPHLIAVTKLGGGGKPGIPPPPILAGTDQVGFNDILIDADGIVRRGLLFQDTGDEVSYAFALRLALHYLEAEGVYPEPDPVHPEFLRLGPTTLHPFESSDGGYIAADAGGYQILLDYRGAQSPLRTITLTDLLEGRADPSWIRDSVVLIGVTAESVPDLFHTPHSSTFLGGQMMPGVLLHAHIANQLLRAGLDGQSSLLTISDPQEYAWIVLWGVLGGLLGLWARSPWRLTAGLAVGGVVLGGIGAVAFRQGWWIPEIPPFLAWFVAAAVVNAGVLHQERRQRTLLMQLFSQHVSGQVAEAIWQQRDQFLEGGRPRSQELIATVLFTDFKGYSSVSERVDPQSLMAWVNTYLEAMTEVVLNHEGVIDDYAGDAIKANFGVPFRRTTDADIARDAVNAVRCALAMEVDLHRLNEAHARQELPTVGMRIGIYTGPVVAGSVGSRRRLKYTTVGDAVNTAARLESLDREIIQEEPGRRPCRILIGESTAHYLGTEFRVERVGEVSVKGKDRPVVVYRVLGQV